MASDARSAQTILSSSCFSNAVKLVKLAICSHLRQRFGAEQIFDDHKLKQRVYSIDNFCQLKSTNTKIEQKIY